MWLECTIMAGLSTWCLSSLRKKRQEPYLDAPSHFSGSLLISFKSKRGKSSGRRRSEACTDPYPGSHRLLSEIFCNFFMSSQLLKPAPMINSCREKKPKLKTWHKQILLIRNSIQSLHSCQKKAERWGSLVCRTYHWNTNGSSGLLWKWWQLTWTC